MINDFEKLRKKLHDTIELYGLDSEETRKVSEQYNELVNIYYQNEKQYQEGSLMYVKYLESIACLKKITKDFAKFPTIKEWNYYAKENVLLNSESLKYISGKDWYGLKSTILSKR